MKDRREKWALLWRSNGSDPRRHLINQDCMVRLFHTKQEAVKFNREHYGHIAKRKDLRGHPHFWLMPIPVKVNVTYEWSER